MSQTSPPLALVILAAGQGTRMNSDLPKALQPLGGVPLFAHALAAGAALEPARTILVTGHDAEAVETAARALDPDLAFVRQEQQLGTGHAVQQAQTALADFSGDLLVLYADTPFVRPETLARMVAARAEGADLVLLGFQAAPESRYGRLILQGEALARIVEWKDAGPEQRAVTFMNAGLLLAPAPLLFELLAGVGQANAAGEVYLTDTVALAHARGLRCTAIACDEAEVLGVNSRPELARAEALFQSRRRAEAQDDGAVLIAPETVHFALDTALGRDAVVEPYVVFGPGVSVESGARIRSFSHLEGAHVSAGAIVGPFARLRPGAELADGAHVGNFVEVKAAQIGPGAKVNHLSYIGDAEVGEGTNIGAGTITCNYDGVFKHRTVIGRRAFIGSNTMLVAPVSVGDEALTGSGSVITRDVAAGDLALGRARQVAKPGLGRKIIERLRALKAQGKG